jgi:hypothetical protein
VFTLRFQHVLNYNPAVLNKQLWTAESPFNNEKEAEIPAKNAFYGKKPSFGAGLPGLS